MVKRHLDGGVDRIIHILPKEMASGEMRIAVRLESKPETVEFLCRHIQILGPSYIPHLPDDPIPGTMGRGVLVLRTQGPLVLFCDG